MRDFYEKAYHYELERKSKIHAAIAIPVGISTVAIAAIKYAFENYRHDDWFSLVLLLPLIVAISYLVRVFFFIRGFLDFGSYEVISNSRAYLDHQRELEEFSEQYTDAPEAELTFEQHLIDDYSKCASINAEVNDRRSNLLYKINFSSYVLILFAMVSAALVLLNKTF